jgi:hypothetical protein
MAMVYLTRNTATLEAYRQHQRAIRAAAQPWLTVVIVTSLIQFALLFYEFFHHSFRAITLLNDLIGLVALLAGAIAATRSWLYRRSHPLELPETPSVFSWCRKLS